MGIGDVLEVGDAAAEPDVIGAGIGLGRQRARGRRWHLGAGQAIGGACREPVLDVYF
jgi:hypothetical protein